MKILTYNILDGGEARTEGVVRAVQEINPDLAVLNELNGWTPAEGARFPGYHFLLNDRTTSNYRVGAISKKPATRTTVHTEGLGHGAVELEFPGFLFIGIHLHPTTEERRLSEVQAIAHLLSRTDKPVILAGDLNAVNPANGPTDRACMVIPFLKDMGFVDPLEGADDIGSIPTPLVNKPDAKLQKIDYVLLKGIAYAHPGRVIHDEKFDHLSDHWPVEIELPELE